jgi:hypothetical protein
MDMSGIRAARVMGYFNLSQPRLFKSDTRARLLGPGDGRLPRPCMEAGVYYARG